MLAAVQKMRKEIHAAPHERFYEAAAITALLQCVHCLLEPPKKFSRPIAKGNNVIMNNDATLISLPCSMHKAQVINTSFEKVFLPTIVNGINHVFNPPSNFEPGDRWRGRSMSFSPFSAL